MKFKSVLIQGLFAFLTISYFSLAIATSENLQVKETLEKRRYSKSSNFIDNEDSYEFGIKRRRPNSYEYSQKFHSPKVHKKIIFLQKKQKVANVTRKTVTRFKFIKGLFPPGAKYSDNKRVDMLRKNFYAKNKKCVEKTGLLYYYFEDEIKNQANSTLNKKFGAIKPAYVILNENTFSIFDNRAPESLLKVVKVEKILRVTQQYQGSTCLDLIEEKKELHPIVLCTETPDEMDEWIVAILEFKECLLKEKFEIIDANANTFATKEEEKKGIVNQMKGRPGYFPKPIVIPPPKPVKFIGRKKTVELIEKPKPVRDALYYTNTFAPTSEILEITETDKALTKILNDNKREEIAQRQMKRQIDDKIKRVKEAQKKILKEEKKLAKKNAENKKKEIAVQTQKIENLAKTQEKTILTNAFRSLKQINVKFSI